MRRKILLRHACAADRVEQFQTCHAATMAKQFHAVKIIRIDMRKKLRMIAGMDIIDTIQAVASVSNDCFMAGMAAHESQTTRKLAQLLLDVDEAIYQLSRVHHPITDEVMRRLQHAVRDARQ